MVASRTIKLDVISDLVCPWCYVGHVELQRAITQARTADLPATLEIQYHPYLLVPSLSCEEAVVKDEYWMQKFGAETWGRMKQFMQARGTAEGIDFSFGGLMRNTIRPHRLLLKAWRIGGEKAQIDLINELFRAFFEEEKDIGDYDVLISLAGKVGFMTKDEAETFLKSTELQEEVVQMSGEASKKGITGVPFTVIDGKWAVKGGQSADVYLKIFQKLANTEIVPEAPQPVAATVTAQS